MEDLRRSKLKRNVISTSNSLSTSNKMLNKPQEVNSIEFISDLNPFKERRSSLTGEATPVNICTSIIEDDFMLDSLNEQQNIPRHTFSVTQNVESKKELQTGESGTTFMNALETAINHFEKKNPQETKKISKRSPSFSYSTNITTGNSVNDSSAEYEVLRNQYTLLLNKYNELQLSNKQLMNDYAVLRSQLEEVKAVMFSNSKA